MPVHDLFQNDVLFEGYLLKGLSCTEANASLNSVLSFAVVAQLTVNRSKSNMQFDLT